MKSPLPAIVAVLILSVAANSAVFNIADLNKDGIVNLGDLDIMAANWMQRTLFEEPDIQFVSIPAGDFIMGDESGVGLNHELPRHTVSVTAFELSKYEVTNRQYSLFLNNARAQGLIKVINGVVYAADDTEDAEPWLNTTAADTSSNISYGGSVFSVVNRDGKDMSDHPVINVSWYGADAFCRFYGWRLPTEAEWEYADRGGFYDPYAMYPWGANNINASMCNYGEAKIPTRTTTVGTYSAYGYGLCDMAGNAFEWCSDWYSDDYYAELAALPAPAQDPQGPETGTTRILRGGYYLTTDLGCRAAFRYKNTPDKRSYFGFRPARDIQFVPVPAGEFLMGDESDAGAEPERPRHTVTIAPFEMSKYEVTNQQYSEFLNTARIEGLIKVLDGVVYAHDDHQNARPWFSTTADNPASNISYGELTFSAIVRDGKDMSDHPVIMVSWYGADACCRYYGWRLPTEAEWEYAARGGYYEPYAKYPWGNNDINPAMCNYADARIPSHTTPVGTYPAYGYGLCDMAGNVYEWCSNWYSEEYYAELAALPAPPQDPPGPETGNYRVLRGGYYRTIANGCRVAFRYKNAPQARSDFGFRPVRDLPPR